MKKGQYNQALAEYRHKGGAGGGFGHASRNMDFRCSGDMHMWGLDACGGSLVAGFAYLRQLWEKGSRDGSKHFQRHGQNTQRAGTDG